MNEREKCRIRLGDVKCREGMDSLEPHQNHPPCPRGQDLVLTRSRCIQVSETHRLGSADGSAPSKKTNFVLPMLQATAAGQRYTGTRMSALRCLQHFGGKNVFNAILNSFFFHARGSKADRRT